MWATRPRGCQASCCKNCLWKKNSILDKVAEVLDFHGIFVLCSMLKLMVC